MRVRSPKIGGGCANDVISSTYVIRLGIGGNTMTKSKHVHKWEYGDNQDPMGTPDWWMGCGICHETMLTEEIARRLNATERLSADNAGVAAQVFRMGANSDLIRPFGDYDPLLIFEALSDYALILDDKDERN